MALVLDRYDVAGVAPDRIQRIIEHDWIYLIHKRGILDSPNYLREKGKAVVSLWGLGMSGQGHDPATVRAITRFIRENTPGGAYIMAGTPAYWRTSTNDADPNPEFKNVFLEEYDAISPWTIGRYNSLEGADKFAEEVIAGDVQLINKRNQEFENGFGAKRRIDYIPVVHPGASVCYCIPFVTCHLLIDRPVSIGLQFIPRQMELERCSQAWWELPLETAR